MAPPLNGAPAPLLEPEVWTEWLAEELLGLQSIIVMLVAALAGTEAIISMVICDKIVAVLSILLRLSLAMAVKISIIPAGKPTGRINAANNISTRVKPPSGSRTASFP